MRTVVTMLSPEEQDRLREMEDWIIKNEGTWVLSEGFNTFLGKDFCIGIMEAINTNIIIINLDII